MIKQLEAFKKASSDLLEAWHQDLSITQHNILERNYPFDKDFTELEFNISDWVDDAVSSLEELSSHKTLVLKKVLEDDNRFTTFELYSAKVTTKTDPIFIKQLYPTSLDSLTQIIGHNYLKDHFYEVPSELAKLFDRYQKEHRDTEFDILIKYLYQIMGVQEIANTSL